MLGTMARPTCSKCDNTSFTLEEIEPRNSSYKIAAVCCSSCGAIVSTTEIFNAGVLVKQLAKKLGFDI